MPCRKKGNLNPVYLPRHEDIALTIAGISKHQYYYKPTCKKLGRKPSTSTLKIEGGMRIKLPMRLLFRKSGKFKKILIPIMLPQNDSSLNDSWIFD